MTPSDAGSTPAASTTAKDSNRPPRRRGTVPVLEASPDTAAPRTRRTLRLSTGAYERLPPTSPRALEASAASGGARPERARRHRQGRGSQSRGPAQAKTRGVSPHSWRRSGSRLLETRARPRRRTQDGKTGRPWFVPSAQLSSLVGALVERPTGFPQPLSSGRESRPPSS